VLADGAGSPFGDQMNLCLDPNATQAGSAWLLAVRGR